MSMPIAADQLPWIPIAKRVLRGEFINADWSTVESLKIGLRSIQHPLCIQASALLHKMNVPKKTFPSE